MIITKDSYFLFSGGEVGYSLPKTSESSISHIIMNDYSMNGFMALCQHKERLDREGLKATVSYPYFPYARQDRAMTIYDSFSLKVFCNLLNSQNFDKVTVYDPHSDVTPALINNVEIIPQWQIAKEILPNKFFTDRNVTFVSPDAGAYKKVSKLMNDDTRIAIGVKNRDTTTGRITNTDVFSPLPITGQDCVIVDDICDGGRTFIELAKVLRQKGAKKIYLYVTHGIFSQGIDVLKEHIDHIYTTNSFPNLGSDYMIVKNIL